MSLKGACLTVNRKWSITLLTTVYFEATGLAGVGEGGTAEEGKTTKRKEEWQERQPTVQEYQTRSSSRMHPLHG